MEDRTYKIKGEVVNHNTPVGFLLEAPFNREVVFTANDIAGLVVNGFKVEGVNIKAGRVILPTTKRKKYSFEHVINKGIYISHNVFTERTRVEELA